MGRNKIAIEKISNERNRQATFTKRKAGLIKKAMELSILCDCEVALIIYNSNSKLYQYSSSDLKKMLSRVTQFGDSGKELTNDDYKRLFLSKSKRKKRDDSEEESEEDEIEEKIPIKKRSNKPNYHPKEYSNAENSDVKYDQNTSKHETNNQNLSNMAQQQYNPYNTKTIPLSQYQFVGGFPPNFPAYYALPTNLTQSNEESSGFQEKGESKTKNTSGLSITIPDPLKLGKSIGSPTSPASFCPVMPLLHSPTIPTPNPNLFGSLSPTTVPFGMFPPHDYFANNPHHSSVQSNPEKSSFNENIKVNQKPQ